MYQCLVHGSIRLLDIPDLQDVGVGRFLVVHLKPRVSEDYCCACSKEQLSNGKYV